MDHIRDLPNTNNKCIGFGLVNIEMFIIHIGFKLTNIDTIYTLIRHKYDPLIRIVISSSRNAILCRTK